ncbi:MAG: HPr family phosphocarrier protein [Ruminococcus sp.]|nr:HPr family phosphocarrier protein [Ruminococcus sp.]
MVSKKVTLVNAQGFHMRPADDFVNAVKKYPCKVTLMHNGKSVNLMNKMFIIASAIKCGQEVEVICDGPEEDAALAELTGMIENGFGE